MRLDELEAAIRDKRPDIDAEFARMLDERAAAGFPRQATRAGRAAALAARLRTTPPRRLVAPALGAATALVIVDGAVVSLGGTGGGSGGTASLSSAPERSLSRPAAKAGAGAGAAAGPARDRTFGNLGALGARTPAARSPRAQAALGTPQVRRVARNAQLALSTDPGKVRSVADGVVQVTRRYRGLVISSEITSGKGGGRPRPVPLAPAQLPYGLGAEFQLRIPAAKLEAALDDLSHLGFVVSRTEGTEDITGRFASAKQRIANLTGERDALIARLASAVTTEAIDTIKHRLAVVRRLLVRAQNQLGHLHERVRMVPVHVSIVPRGSGAGGGGGSFGIGDALHDAGRVLTVAASVLLISLAVLAPLAILGALAWLAARSAIRWRRERALGI
jgi:Domain of unknown function (DUF4349)